MNNTQWQLISFIGADANKFLQGQIPVNLEQLTAQQSTYSCVTLHTGKVIGTFRLFKLDEQNIHLLVYGVEQANRILAHFKKYAVFSKVTITLSTASIHFYNENLPAEFMSLDSNNFIVHTDYCLSFGISFNNLDSSAFSKLAFTNEDAKVLNDQQVLALTTALGFVYDLKAEYVDTVLPQALGIDLLEQAISFKKGCYQGQEGIARAKYRGTNPNSQQLFTLDTQKLEEAQQAQLHVRLDVEAEKASGKLLAVVDVANLTLPDNLAQALKDKTLVASTIITNKLPANEYQYFIQADTNTYNLQAYTLNTQDN
ncbi:CAF17-like 4Fe-4S cluster assembly/insertion protein YgfZ [Psittacicella hinzii]|uniref:Uncharacterized protein n=1 Tax=Psittacicella hinzii TaxID=2028575 RepID=A0A3A1YCE5_9GAMM|nr:hypothetical protein [Psittacicella hinzii]RIY35046.1 hypothetical protein CKF58_07185 [Psittacicella hinzii]